MSASVGGVEARLHGDIGFGRWSGVTVSLEGCIGFGRCSAKGSGSSASAGGFEQTGGECGQGFGLVGDCRKQLRPRLSSARQSVLRHWRRRMGISWNGSFGRQRHFGDGAG